MPAEGAVEEPRPETLEAARRGSLAAFEEIVRACQHDVWRFTMNVVRDREAAEDVTQETFVRAFRALGRYRGDAKFTTWLLTIARNCALDEVRRKARRRDTTDALEAQPYQSATGDPATALEVREALASLPVELRESIVLIDMLGESYADAASVLHLPVGTVKSRVHRARDQMLTALLERKENADEG
jgi:RNA polymerase sigma-70 factor (ECF subfamily)